MKTSRAQKYLVLMIVAVVTLQPLNVWAERATVDFGPFSCVPGKTPTVIKEETYVNLMLINVLNAPAKPWFVSGESTISTKVTFRHSPGKEWNYVRTIEKVGNSFTGIDQNVALGPRRMPLPKVIGGFQPSLTVTMIETGRDQAYKPLLDGLNKVATTIPNPATGAASLVLSTVSDIYTNVFTAWMAKNGLSIEANMGFSFDSDTAKSCDNLGAGTPLLGNVAYLILGTTEINGKVINKAWAKENLKLDSDGSLLLFKKDTTLKRSWPLPDIEKKVDDRFELTSYMLLRFETSATEILKGAELYNNEELRQQFAEARQAGNTDLRKVKRKVLADNLLKSTLLSYSDTCILLHAFDSYIVGQDEEWDIFLTNWAKSLKKEEVLKTLNALQDETKDLPANAARETVSTIVENPEALRQFQDSVAELGAKERITILKALADAGHNPGPIIDMDDYQTRQAVKEFQASKGLTADGTLNFGTLKVLNLFGPDRNKTL